MTTVKIIEPVIEPFESGSFRHYSSVEHIRSVSWLYGIETPETQYARLLVLGCGDGAELLPFVEANPHASAVGVELETENFDAKQKAALVDSTDNLQLYSASLETFFESDLGQFDYIIIQNSFSLLSNEITDALLLSCQQRLSPQGVIAIDWLCQPGAKLLEMVRDAAQIHSSLVTSHSEQVVRTREILNWIDTITHENNPIKNNIRNALKQSEEMSDSLLSHFYLENKNEASYLVEFNARIENSGLMYVGDLRPATEHADYYDDEVEKHWQELSKDNGKILTQQYLDIAVNRNKRFSLLTLSSKDKNIFDNVDYKRLQGMRWAGSFRRRSQHIRSTPNLVAGHDNIPIATDDITTLSIMDVLGEAWPYSVSFEQLVFNTHLPDNDPDNISFEDHEKKVLAALVALFKKNISALHYQLGDDAYSSCDKHALMTSTPIAMQLHAFPAKKTVINLWNECVNISSEEREQLLKESYTLIDENRTLIDGLHRKGLLTASVLGWKNYYQSACVEAKLDEVGRLACSLLLFSSDASAGGFYTRKFELQENKKNLGEEGDQPVDIDLIISINKLIIKGKNESAFELVSKNNKRLIESLNGNYYLVRFYRRVAQYELVILTLVRMLSFQSTSLFIYSELAMALHDYRMSWQSGRLARAILRCDSKSSPDWYLLGILHKESKTFERAEYCARKGVELAPESKQLVNLLGSCLCEQAKTDEGIAFLRKSIKNPMRDYGYFGGLAFILTHSGKASAQEILDCHLGYAQGLMAWATQQTFSGYEPVDKNIHRKLRIGFVSGDFSENHPVSFFFTPVWQALDRNEFELYAYNSAPAYARNAGTDYFEETADSWRDIQHTSTLEFAEMIKEDQIDILVDLSGHTAHNRLTTFALKPAPVQISWVGYHATTGLPTMDYYATIFPVPKDKALEAQFTEKLIYLSLPRNFNTKEENQIVNNLPALESRVFTFGSFNRPNKINNEVLSVWAEVLNSCPESKMIIGNMAIVLWEDILQKLESQGVERSRITLYESTSMQGYLKYHNEVDLLLDTFPFTGGTVTSHAAWMGVPTVSLSGETLVSRQGASIMYSLGLPEFVATSKEDYIAIAIKWTTRLEELNKIRLNLRSSMKIEHNQQGKIGKYTSEMFRQCWAVYCTDKAKESFMIGEIYEQKLT